MAVSRNRPDWRMPLRKGPSNSKPPQGIPFGQWPEQYRCKAMARATGERCRNAAIHGSQTCHKHGGHANGYRKAREQLGERFVPLVHTQERKALATLGALFGDGSITSIVERGERLEATKLDGSQIHSVRDTVSGTVSPDAQTDPVDQVDDQVDRSRFVPKK